MTQTPRLSGRLFVIGAGSMAEAFIRGLTERGAARGDQISVLNKSRPARLAELAAQYGIHPAAGYDAAQDAEMVILAVKPFDMAEALQAVAPYLHGQPVLSFAAGVTIGWMREQISHRSPVIRTMPNIPVAVQAGATAISFAPDVTGEQRRLALYLLSQLGTVVQIPESLMDAATAFSGSGPGFVSYFLEAMENAAVQLGFTPELARAFLLQTVMGTARTLVEWGLSPEELRRRVTSPNGTTHAGVQVMEAGRLRDVVAEALQAAARRSAEMGAAYVVEGS